MTAVICPHCNNKVLVTTSSLYKCSFCNGVFNYKRSRIALILGIVIVVLLGYCILTLILISINPQRQEDLQTNKQELPQQSQDQAAKEIPTTDDLVTQSQIVNEDLPEEQESDVITNLEDSLLINKSIANNSSYTLYKVKEIVDGDTIIIEAVGTLRLIGIDTPETKDPSKPVQCFGQEATMKATELLKDKRVRLEFDNSQGRVDKYGRTLAYVYREDGLFYNYEMINQGFASEYTYSTSYKYQTTFKKAQDYAKENALGLWGKACSCEKDREISRLCTGCNELTIIRSNWDCSEYEEKISDTNCNSKCPTVAAPISQYQCDCSKTCPQMSCTEAQFQLNSCGCTKRDGDHDGVACDTQCQ